MSAPPFSKMKPAEKFLLKWREQGYEGSTPVQEHPFDAVRGWRFDFAWPQFKVAVEIHGFGYGHQAQQHVAKDCEKMRSAIQNGWIVIPFTSRCLGSIAKCEAAAAEVFDVICQRSEAG